MALWARPAHANLMAESTADDRLTVTVTPIVVVSAHPEHAVRTLPSVADHRVVEDRTQWNRVVEDRTQWIVLSVIFNNPMVCGTQEGPYSMLRSAATTNIAFAPLAQR